MSEQSEVKRIAEGLREDEVLLLCWCQVFTHDSVMILNKGAIAAVLQHLKLWGFDPSQNIYQRTELGDKVVEHLHAGRKGAEFVKFSFADGRYVLVPRTELNAGMSAIAAKSTEHPESIVTSPWIFRRELSGQFHSGGTPSIYDRYVQVLSKTYRIQDEKPELEPVVPKGRVSNPRPQVDLSAYRNMPLGQFPHDELAIEICDWLVVEVDLGEGLVQRKGQVQQTRCSFCPSLCLVRLEDGQEKLVRRADVRHRAFPPMLRERGKIVGKVDYLDLDIE